MSAVRAYRRASSMLGQMWNSVHLLGLGRHHIKAYRQKQEKPKHLLLSVPPARALCGMAGDAGERQWHRG